jgi:cobalt transporter subunit CbtA
MFGRILFAAVIGGFAAALLLTGVQAFKVLPLILEAETYETAAVDHAHGAQAESDHAHDADAWAPADGGERLAYTLMTNVLTGIGFALLLTAAMTLRGGAGWREGLVWGLAGYAVFSLAPAMGLPPELPGMAAGDLAARQVWWTGTVIATGGGLALIVFVPRAVFRALGVALIVVPHAIGAPHPEAAHGAVPAELAAAFVSATLVANLLFWLAIGGVSAYAFERLRAPEVQRA